MFVGGTLLALVIGLTSVAEESETGEYAWSTPASDEIWIGHRVRAHEDLGSLSERYGVTIDQLRAWNELPDRETDVDAGTTLRVKPTVTPPPLQQYTIVVRKDETWAEAAERLGVSVDELRRSNPRLARRKRPPKGARLTGWVESRVVRYPLPDFDTPLPDVSTPEGGFSVGTPNKGTIVNAVALPANDAYTIRFERLAYGSTLTVHGVQQAIVAFRQETGYDGNVTIGAISRKSGRKLRPHKSHQSGRDVDVRLPAMRYAKQEAKLEAKEVDWAATYALLDAFVRTGDVQVIYLERKFYSRLRRAGRRLGADEARIQRVLSHLRHDKGHVHHFHVRFNCSEAADKCADATRPRTS